MSGTLHLLGPQRPSPNLPQVLSALPGDGPIVYITAGWRHDEADIEALQRDIGTEGTLVPLYRWFDELAPALPTLFEAYHIQQQEIRKLKALYRLRLDPAIQALRLLYEQRIKHPYTDFVRWEFEDAIQSIRTMRTRFIRQCDAIRDRFEIEWQPEEYPLIFARHREIMSAFHHARVILIAGGHVGVLRNRLEFFRVGRLLKAAMAAGTHLVAWSAGAMVLTDEVVLFNDDSPMGQHHPEILDRGLGIAKGLVCLPHAKERLALEDQMRVSIFAARFDPIPCIGLENGAWLTCPNGLWINQGRQDSAIRLLPDGSTASMEVVNASSI